jgi:hypothetical protein
MANCK